MSISEKMRSSIDNSSLIRKMFEEGGRLKKQFGADNVYDFSLGNPDISPPPDFYKVLREKAENTNFSLHSYPPEQGIPQVQEAISGAISEEQGFKIAPEDVIMTYGAAGGLNIALKALLNPADEVIILRPFFVDYTSYIENHGGIPIIVATDKNFDLDISAIADAISPKTKALVINSPNNPTGQVYSEEALKTLGVLLEDKSAQLGNPIFLISDEPYRKIVYDDVIVPSIFHAYKNSIVATSYSKDLSLPGERIGYLAVHPEIQEKDAFLQAMRFANKILGFYNAPILMQHVISELQTTSIDNTVYTKRKQIFCEILSDAGYSFMEPKGTFYIFPKAPGGDDLKFCEYLLEENILAVPGVGFGIPGYFRLAFCVPDSVIKKSAAGFIRAIGRV